MPYTAGKLRSGLFFNNNLLSLVKIEPTTVTVTVKLLTDRRFGFLVSAKNHMFGHSFGFGQFRPNIVGSAIVWNFPPNQNKVFVRRHSANCCGP